MRWLVLSEQDLGRSRAEASQKLLAELNGAVQVCVYTGDITKDLLLDFQVPSQPYSPGQPPPPPALSSRVGSRWFWPY